MGQGEKPKTVAKLVADARTRVQSLTPEQVAAELKQGALLIDLRESEERNEYGCIPGTVHAPRGMLEFWADPTSDSTARNSIQAVAPSCTAWPVGVPL